MVTVTIIGKVYAIGDVYTLPNSTREAQKILIECTHQDKRTKTDLFAVFIYGDDIKEFWKYYPEGVSPRYLTITCKLTGRLKNGRDSLTLSYKKVLWEI